MRGECDDSALGWKFERIVAAAPTTFWSALCKADPYVDAEGLVWAPRFLYRRIVELLGLISKAGQSLQRSVWIEPAAIAGSSTEASSCRPRDNASAAVAEGEVSRKCQATVTVSDRAAQVDSKKSSVRLRGGVAELPLAMASTQTALSVQKLR